MKHFSIKWERYSKQRITYISCWKTSTFNAANRLCNVALYRYFYISFCRDIYARWWRILTKESHHLLWIYFATAGFFLKSINKQLKIYLAQCWYLLKCYFFPFRNTNCLKCAKVLSVYFDWMHYLQMISSE